MKTSYIAKMKKFLLSCGLTLGSKKYPHNTKEYAEGLERYLFGGLDIAGGAAFVAGQKRLYGEGSISCAGGVEHFQGGFSLFGDFGKGLADCGARGLINLNFSPVFSTFLLGLGVQGFSGAIKAGVNIKGFCFSAVGQAKLPYKELKKPIYTLSVCVGIWGNACPVGKWNAEEPLLREYDKIAGPKRKNESVEEYNLRVARRKSELDELWRTLPEDQKLEYGSMCTGSNQSYGYSYSEGVKTTTVMTRSVSVEYFDGNICPKNLYRLRRIARYKAKMRVAKKSNNS